MSVGWRENQPSGITDAPSDGSTYGRNNAAWVVVPGGAPVSYTATYWVDPAGSGAASGRSPAQPTTLANAIATAPAGSRIELAAGTYAGVTIGTDGLAFVGAAQSTASATASVRFTSGVTLGGRNCHFVGVQFGALTDASGAAGAGTTVLE